MIFLSFLSRVFTDGNLINSCFLFAHRDTQESSRSPTPLNLQPNLQQPNINDHMNSRSKRFSSPPYSDYGCDKVNSRNINGKISKRNVRSMNEAIEVLADQVEEENVVSYWKINMRKKRKG